MNNAMIDMKRPKPKKGTLTKQPEGATSSEEYPYGLRISFERQEIDKLDLDVSKLKMGQKCSISGEGEVQSISMSENKGEPDNKSISIQIKAIEITWGKAPVSLYKGNRKGK
jgi:hypothetical protein